MPTTDKIVTALDLEVFEPEHANWLQERTLLAPSNPTVAFPGTDPGADDEVVKAASLTDPSRLQTGPGGLRRYFVQNAVLMSTARVLALDDSVDWRDRIVWLPRYAVMTSLGYLPGGADDDEFGASSARNTEMTTTPWYTGTGALSAAAANPTAGNPPTTGYLRYLLDPATFPAGDNLIIYVESLTPFRLCIYNEATGVSRAFAGIVEATPKLGKRP